MLRPDTQKYKLLEMIGISGEFPSEQLPRLFDTPAYTEKMITELKADNLIKLHYKDRLRGYRLKKQAKELLLSHNPLRFRCCLTGNSETNAVRSEPQRRLRLHQKAQTYVTLSHAGIPFFADDKPPLFREGFPKECMSLQNIPCFYSSREIKELGEETTKIRNSRSIGILMAPHCIYCIYNTGASLMKWEYQAEVRLNAFLQHYLKISLYNSQPDIRAIVFGNDMEMALQLLTSTGGKKRGLFMLDTSFQNFYCLPSDTEGELLLKLLTNPKLTARLSHLLLSDLDVCQDNIPFEHDAITQDGVPTLLAYDFDMQKINRFNTGLNVFGLSGSLICFDFQIPVLEKYMNSNVRFSSIDLAKFRKEFLHEP